MGGWEVGNEGEEGGRVVVVVVVGGGSAVWPLAPFLADPQETICAGGID